MKISIEFHEILGHGSGRMESGIEPEKLFGEIYMPMEEGRAELAAVYHGLDYKSLVRFKILPESYDEAKAKEFSHNLALQFFSNHIRSWGRLPGTTIRQAHQLGRQIMLNWALKDKAIDVRLSPTEVPLLLIPDVEKLRESMGRLWANIQEYKSTGEKDEMAELLSKNNTLTAEQIKWKSAIFRALKSLNSPKRALYLNPTFELMQNEKSLIQDVKIVYEPKGEGLEAALNHEIRRSQRVCERDLEIKERP